MLSFSKNFNELSEKARKLEGEISKLVSHQNLNQKIKHHLNLKKENNQLKEVILLEFYNVFSAVHPSVFFAKFLLIPEFFSSFSS